MRHHLILSFFFCFVSQAVFGQYKFDNKLYRTIYLQDLPTELKKTPNALFLDVRTPGEFCDTSQFAGVNIGRLKGTKNINYRELNKHINEISDDKNKPIILVCSHSQRSRRMAKILADSGFTNIVNVNGGMTIFNEMSISERGKLNDLYETSNPFKLISPKDACPFIRSKKDIFILDVRKDSCFRSITEDAQLNSFGQIQGAVNIPFKQLRESISKIPKNRPLFIVDNYGDESAEAANLLKEQGYSDLNVLFHGMDGWSSEDEKAMPKREKIWIHPKDFGSISTEAFCQKMSKNQTDLILDVRTKVEFTNQDTVLTYRNRGHIQKAINIPLADLKMQLSDITTFKNKEVIVYAFSGSPEAFTSAKLLTDNGFTNVKVLTGGLWDIRWKAANLKGCSEFMKWVVDVPVENL